MRSGGEAVPLPEVAGDTTDEKAGIPTGVGQGEREQRGDGGLPVGPGDDDAVALGEEQLLQHRRERRERNRPLARGEHLDVVGAADISDDDPFRPPVEIESREPLIHRHPQGAQLVRHRRIHFRVGAADVVAGLDQEPGQGAHPGPTDADEVKLHGGELF